MYEHLKPTGPPTPQPSGTDDLGRDFYAIRQDGLFGKGYGYAVETPDGIGFAVCPRDARMGNFDGIAPAMAAAIAALVRLKA